MKHLFKLVSLILVITMILSAFLFSCSANNSNSQNNTNNQDNSANASVQDNSAETTTEEIKDDVPATDYGGYNFRVVDRDGYLGMYWITVDMYAEAENGEPINDAVYTRNRIVEDKFNINISEIRKSDTDILPFIQKSIQAGTDDFDFFVPTMQQAGTMIQKGQLANLYDMPYFEFDKPWWDKVSNDSMTVAKKLYGAAGSITTTTNDATWAVLFNKDLLQSYSLPDPYQIVKDGKWTLDVLYANSKAVTKDLNGDGVLDATDQWGTIEQHECAYSLFAASGQKIIEKDADDLPILALNNDRTTAVLTKVINFMSDDTAQIKADDAKNTAKYTNVWDEITTKVFADSRSLYEITNFDMVKSLRSMEANFGILPLPKYDETQPQYYSTLQYNNGTVMCVPVTATNLERTGAVLESWAAESIDTLTKAYYDITLKGKYTRDDESSDMLDLIFSTRVIDQGMFFNWAGMYDFFTGFSTRKTMDFASQYEKAEPKWTAAIDKTIQAIQSSN